MDKPTDKPTSLGMNRTGVGLVPARVKEMTSGIDQLQAPVSAQDGVRIEELRTELSKNSPPVGLMPPPPTVKGAAKAAVQALKGNAPLVFLDKLGERLAYERGGVRLYQAMLAKWEAAGSHPGGPTREELERLCNEELRHFGLVEAAILKLGADPTVITPSADTIAVATHGFFQLLADPRATLTECENALLAVELADNEGWRMLVWLAEKLGQDEVARDFTVALREEEEHLMLVRRWVGNAVFGQAGVEVPVEMELRTT